MKKIITNFIEFYKSITVQAKAAIWFTVSNIILQGLSVICTPLFTRMMTTEEYGTVTLFLSWESFLIIFATLNFSSSCFNVGMVRFEEERDQVSSSLLSLSACCTVLFCIIYFIFREPLNNLFGLSQSIVNLLLVYFFFQPAFLFWSARQRFEYRYKKLVLITIFVAFSQQMLAVITVYLSAEHKDLARIFSMTGISIAAGVFCFLHIINKGRVFYSRKYWSFALKYNLPLLPHFISRQVLGQIDRVMIGDICGKSDVALYGVAYNAGMMIQIIYNAITMSYHPWNYQNIKKKKYDDIAKVTNLILLLFVGISVLLILAAPELMAFFAPSQYQEAIYVIPPVVTSVFFQILYTFFGNVEQYFMKTKFMSLASVAAALLNLGLNYVFIPRFGYIAGAYTTLVCYMAYAIGHYICMKRISKKYMEGAEIYDKHFIGVLSVIMVAFSILINMVYTFFVIRLIVMIVICLVVFIKRREIINLFGMIRKRE